MYRHFSVVTAMLLATSCTPTPSRVDTHDADIKAIQDDQTQWVKDFDSRDLDKIVSHYSDDAIVIDQGAPPLHGREEAKKLYKEGRKYKAVHTTKGHRRYRCRGGLACKTALTPPEPSSTPKPEEP